MSVKLHQTTGTAGGGGRRTPLSLGPASKTNKPQATDVIDVDAISDIPLSQSTNKTSSTHQTVAESKSEHKKSAIPVANEKHHHQAASTTSSSETKSAKEHAAATMINEKKDNKNPKKDLNDKKHENGHNIEQTKQSQTQQQKDKESKTNGHKQNDDGKKHAQPSSTNGNKEHEKDTAGKDNKSKPTTSSSPLTNIATSGEQKVGHAAIDSSPSSEIEIREKPGPKSRKLAEKEKRRAAEEILEATANVSAVSATSSTPQKRTSQRAAAIQANASIASMAFEKNLKGFDDNGDEMESLLLDVEMPEDTEITKAIPSTGKTVSTPISMQQSITDNQKQNELEKPKTVETKKITESLTTKSPIKSTIFSHPITSTPDEKPQYYTQPATSLRSISGRRSLRPLNKEFSFQNSNYRESYRKINTDFDYTGNTSLNVTVGSEIAQPYNESVSSSFSFFGRGKKRERTPPQTSPKSEKSPEHCQLIDDHTELDVSVKSPKRARLDFSGLFGIVASPVTMLRARLSRAKIQSTPNVTSTLQNCEENVENFSGIIGDEKQKNYDNLEPIIMTKNDDDEDVEIEDIKDDEKEIIDDVKKIKDLTDDKILSENNDVVIVEENRRKMCLVM